MNSPSYILAMINTSHWEAKEGNLAGHHKELIV